MSLSYEHCMIIGFCIGFVVMNRFQYHDVTLRWNLKKLDQNMNKAEIN